MIHDKIKMQCKDVPMVPILKFLLRHEGHWCNWTFGNDKDVCTVMPEDVPLKVVHAKMRLLIKKKYVDGCPCGCRGDFEITKKGKEYLNNLLLS